MFGYAWREGRHFYFHVPRKMRDIGDIVPEIVKITLLRFRYQRPKDPMPVVWDAIVLISTTEISIDFHIRLNENGALYTLSHDEVSCIPYMQTDGQADGQSATDNEYIPTPIPRGKRYSHRYKCYSVLVLLKVKFLEEK